MKRSSAERSTRMRERAQQSWPALPNTRERRRRRGLLEVGVGEHDVGRLAAQLERHALDRAPRRPPRSARPTSVEPVKATFATSGCSTSRCPQTLPGPATTLTTPSGSPASSAMLLELERGERRQLGGLEHHACCRPPAPAPASSRRSSAGSSTARSARPRRAARGRSCRRRRRPGSCRRAGARARRRSSGRSRPPCPSRRGRRRSACRRCGPRAARAPRGRSSSASASRRSSVARSAGRHRAPRRERGLRARDRGVGLLHAGLRELGAAPARSPAR